MSSERSESLSAPAADVGQPNPGEGRDHAPSSNDAPSGNDSSNVNGTRREATIAVRGETIGDKDQQSEQADAKKGESSSKPKSPPKAVSAAKVELQRRLPALDDDAEIGVVKEHIVTRDGKADIAFTGTLRASAGPDSAPKGRWQEDRVYETNGGKYVFSKVTRSVFAEDHDTHEAEIFDPSPSSTASQLLRSAREITRSRPLDWTDAAVAFFGYDPLAKALYRKLDGRFEEHIN